MSVRELDFAEVVREAIEALPPELRARLSNLEIEIVDGDPAHPNRLGFYRGVPLTRRGTGYVFTLPDQITIYRAPLERLFGHDPDLLAERIRHTVWHEIAHHFGISDERLREMGRY